MRVEENLSSSLELSGTRALPLCRFFACQHGMNISGLFANKVRKLGNKVRKLSGHKVRTYN